MAGGGGVEIPTQIEQLNFSLAALERRLSLHALNYRSFQLFMLLSQCKRNFNANLYVHCYSTIVLTFVATYLDCVLFCELCIKYVKHMYLCFTHLTWPLHI